jgi:predicted DNA binding protein
MGVTAIVEIPIDACPMGAALSGAPNAWIQVDRVVPVGNDFLPYFWTDADDVDRIVESLQASPAVTDCSVVDVVGEDALVRTEWAEREPGFLAAVTGAGGTIIEATGNEDGWSVTIRFDDHADLGECYRRCDEADVPITLVSVQGLQPPGVGGAHVDLTEIQRKTLSEALQRGYFDVPRQTNLVDLAAEMDVSDTAVSQRLRRGIASLVDSTLTRNDEKGSDE